MKLKRFIASIVATALVGTTFAMTSSITASADDIGTAWLCFGNGMAEQWDAGALPGSTATITGNGDYTVSVDLSSEQAAESILILLIQSDINIYGEDANGNKLYDEMTFRVNSISIDGNEIAYSGPSDGADSTNNDGVSYRLNIYNTWGNNVTDIDANITNTSNITVNFTVSGIKEAQDAPEETEAPAETTTSNSNETTNADGGSTTTTSNSSSSNGDTTTTSASNNDNGVASEDATEDTAQPTGDAGVAGIVLVCALAGAGFVATCKKN